MPSRRSFSISQGIARTLWWWILLGMRRTPAGRFNQFVARRLGGERGAAFLARGKRQNAFARRHAVRVLRYAVNIISLAVLFGVLFLVARWLFEKGYLSAPKAQP